MTSEDTVYVALTQRVQEVANCIVDAIGESPEAQAVTDAITASVVVGVYCNMSAEDIKKVVDASIEVIDTATERRKGDDK